MRRHLSFQGRIEGDIDGLPEVSQAKEALLFYNYDRDTLQLSRDGNAYEDLVPATLLSASVLPNDGITDAAVPLRALIAAAEVLPETATIHFPAGEYFLDITSEIVVPPGVAFDCAEGARFLKANNSSVEVMFSFDGELTATTSLLSGNGAEGATSVSVASAAGFAAGDFVHIGDSTFHLAGDLGPNEELNEIVSISGTTLTLQRPLVNAYATASAAAVTRAAPYREGLKGGEFVVPQGGQGGCLRFQLAYEAITDGVIARGGNINPCLNIRRSRGIVVTDSQMFDGQNQTTAGRGYGFQVADSSYDVTFINCHGANLRENTVNNYSREVKILSCTYDDCFDSGINTHYSLNSGILIQGCTIRRCGIGILAGFVTGTLGADRDVTIQGNRIQGCQGAGISAGANEAVSRGDGLSIIGNQVEDCGRDGANQAGILVSRWDDCLIQNNRVTGKSNGLQRYGVQLVSVADVLVQSNRIGDLTHASGTGIRWDDCMDLKIEHNRLTGIQTNNFHGAGTNSRIDLADNSADDGTVSLQGSERLAENRYGTLFDTNRGAASIADGGTINHGLRATPTWVIVTPSISGEFASVTARGATTVTVAIKGHAGGAGTTQTVYWEAGV